MLYDGLKERLDTMVIENKLTKHELKELKEKVIEKVKEKKPLIIDEIKKAREDGMEQLAKNIETVYEYNLMFDPTTGSMGAENGNISIFFNKMNINIVNNALEIELSQDNEPVGMLFINKDNKVEFDKEDWVLKIA